MSEAPHGSGLAPFGTPATSVPGVVGDVPAAPVEQTVDVQRPQGDPQSQESQPTVDWTQDPKFREYQSQRDSQLAAAERRATELQQQVEQTQIQQAFSSRYAELYQQAIAQPGADPNAVYEWAVATARQEIGDAVQRHQLETEVSQYRTREQREQQVREGRSFARELMSSTGLTQEELGQAVGHLSMDSADFRLEAYKAAYAARDAKLGRGRHDAAHNLLNSTPFPGTSSNVGNGMTLMKPHEMGLRYGDPAYEKYLEQMRPRLERGH